MTLSEQNAVCVRETLLFRTSRSQRFDRLRQSVVGSCQTRFSNGRRMPHVRDSDARVSSQSRVTNCDDRVWRLFWSSRVRSTWHVISVPRATPRKSTTSVQSQYGRPVRITSQDERADPRRGVNDHDEDGCRRSRYRGMVVQRGAQERNQALCRFSVSLSLCGPCRRTSRPLGTTGQVRWPARSPCFTEG